MPIESVVVVLSGREEPWPTHGSYRTSPPGEAFSGVHFRIEAVYQRTMAELASHAEGPETVGDMVLDLPTGDLSTWLATLNDPAP
ncbi:uncharacterized protein SOCE26_032400 [Sorangium cellulosum]|uniref:Uncharacterized protein n=1 Tax=Sorangium cellulosum TaxID=56 RepID=A0A2L0ERB2_SORCE|nr:hypothetical protein [Sorangium cellulosum]AUX41815.1 uncharacterized protein SOCE26_032400 [Sorangium cellulosum]